MKRICFVRHGETEWNKTGKTQGVSDIKLSERGRTQAESVGLYLEKKGFNITNIYASDLSRAVETAEILNSKLDKPMTIIKEFREISFGDWEGLRINEIKDKYSQEYITWRNEPHKMIFSSGDSLDSISSRSLKMINSLLLDDSNKDGMIVIVSHATAIKTMIMSLLGFSLDNYYKFSISNASISIVDVRDYGNVLTLYNDINHLV